MLIAYSDSYSHTARWKLVFYYECGQPFTHKNVDICLLQLWAEKVFGMYTSWARKQGYKVGLIEKIFSTSGHIQSATMEIESEYMFGTLSGEKGMHQMIYSSIENSDIDQVIILSVVIC